MRLGCAFLGVALLAVAGCSGGTAPVAAAAAAPAPDRGAAPGGAGGPDAGATPDAGSADAGASACAALVPGDPGDPVTVDLDLGDPGEICSAAQPDENGAVPLRVATYDDNGLHRAAWSFYRAPDGKLLSRREWGAGLGPISLLAQPDGFAGIGFSGDPSQEDLDLFLLGHDGADVSIARTPARAGEGDPVADPSGGTVLFSVHRNASVWLLLFERYDAQGNRTAKAVDGAGGPASQEVHWVAGVTSAGDTLVVFPAGASCGAVWLDRDGVRVSAVFAPPTCRIHRFYPLLDGSLAVETTSLDASRSISLAVAARATAFDNPPHFLDGLSLRELFALPGGKGYALREQGSGERFRLLLPSGRSCGELASPALDGPAQIGRDGTLIEQDAAGAGCRFRWYPGLFR